MKWLGSMHPSPPRRSRELASKPRGNYLRNRCLGTPVHKGAGSSMKRGWIIAALVAWAALALGGAAEASVAASPPAPRRVAASLRHSAAGASATATRGLRARHGRRHHRGLRPAEGPRQISARPSGSTAGGSSPPLPARRSSGQRHNAALSPPPHLPRPLARTKAGSPGLAAVSPSCIAVFTAMSRLDSNPVSPPISQDDPVASGRGPPRAGPQCVALSPSLIAASGFSRTPNSIASQPDENRSGPLSPFEAPPAFARAEPVRSVLFRDRLESRPHADRLEGAAACFDSPSTGGVSCSALPSFPRSPHSRSG